MQHPSKISVSILYCNQQVMGNTPKLPAIEGSEQNFDRTHPLMQRAEEAFTRAKTATKAGVFAVSMGLAGAGIASAQETSQAEPLQVASSGIQQSDANLIRVGLEENPEFHVFRDNGLEAGDRGADQPNRFDPYMEQFLTLTQPSQDFILQAFTAGKLTEVPEGKNLDVENGKLAVNLINLVTKMEKLALFIETREIPETEALPRVDTILDRLLRKYPNVEEIITPDMQVRVAELEADVDRVLGERLANAQAENEALREGLERLDAIEERMQALYNASKA